jgi:hypothetical protein
MHRTVAPHARQGQTHTSLNVEVQGHVPACIVCSESGLATCPVLGKALYRKLDKNSDSVDIIMRLLQRRNLSEACFDSELTCVCAGPSEIIAVGDTSLRHCKYITRESEIQTSTNHRMNKTQVFTLELIV